MSYEARLEKGVRVKLKFKYFILILTAFDLISCAESPTSQLSEEFPVLRSGPFGMNFSFIPRGHFEMGSPDDEEGRSNDETLHWVKISKDYWMQTTEVTRGQWFAVMGYYPKVCGPVVERPEFPVTCVTWNEVNNFVVKLNNKVKKDGYEYRLPTEAQWEYAARAYTQTAYSVEGLLDSFGWYYYNSKDSLHPVAQLKVNNFGLYDVHGNVAELVSDLYGPYPEITSPKYAAKDPKGPLSQFNISIVRGGARYNSELGCRLASRVRVSRSARDSNFGFRLVREEL